VAQSGTPPSLPPCHPPIQRDPEPRIRALRRHSCSPGAWHKDAKGLFGGLNTRPRWRPFRTPRSWRSEPAYAGRSPHGTCSAATRAASSCGAELQAAAQFWRDMFRRFHPQNASLKRLHYQQKNGQVRHSKDSTARFPAWYGG